MNKLSIGLICLVFSFVILIPKFANAEIVPVSGSIISDTTWSSSNIYVINSSFSVPAGVTLTIEPGTIVKAKNTGMLGMSIYGRIVARGTSESPIYFTSWTDDNAGGDTNGDGPSSGAPGGWQGLYFKEGSEADFDYVNLRYAGYGAMYAYNYGHLVGIENDGGIINIRHSNIRNNHSILSDWVIGHYRAGYGIYNKSGTLNVTDSVIDNSSTGIYIESGTANISGTTIKSNTGYSAGYGVYASGSDPITLLNNSFSNNAYTAHIDASKEFVHEGNTSADMLTRGFIVSGYTKDGQTWHSSDLPIIIKSNVHVKEGKTLNIAPGTVIKIGDNVRGGSIVVHGALKALGTPGNKIYFTSHKDDSVGGDSNGNSTLSSPAPRDWNAIFLENGSSAEFKNVVLRYSGYNYLGEYLPGVAAAVYQRGADFTVSDSIFEKNYGTSIFQDAGTTAIQKSAFTNGDFGIWSRGGSISISESNLSANSGYSVYNQGGPTIDARNNWWGDPTGPNVVSNPSPTGNGSRINGDVLYIPFWEEEEGYSLTNKVIEKTKAVIGGRYTSGGKGFDWNPNDRKYLSADKVGSQTFTYYMWNPKLNDFAPIAQGVDCSGLSMWSYNSSHDLFKYKSIIKYERADGQYHYNTLHVNKGDEQPGDLMFFNWDGDVHESGPLKGLPEIDHVAVYTGSFIHNEKEYDGIEARDEIRGITTFIKDSRAKLDAFIGFGRINEPVVNFSVKTYSPIDLEVTDPDGITVGPETSRQSDTEVFNEIPGELYYTVYDIESNGTPKIEVFSPQIKKGDYIIKPIKREDALSGSTYSIGIETGAGATLIAESTSVDSIPETGYGVTVSDENNIETFVPIIIDIKPGSENNTVNPKSNGVLPVSISGSTIFDVREVEVDSIRLGGVLIKANKNSKLIYDYSDINNDGLSDILIKIPTESLDLDASVTELDLEGTLKDGTIIKGKDLITVVPKKI